MEKFILSTDTCCDEMKSNLKKSRIEYIPMCYICEGEIYEDNFDSLEEYKFFYDEMKRGVIYSTTGLNPFQVKEYFDSILNKYNSNIVHISLSSGLSGTHSVVQKVANEINETSKNKVYILDSLGATQVQNLVLNYAKKLRDEGKTAEETMKELEAGVKKVEVRFFLSNLEALKRGGRINGAQAVMAKVMQLRPMLRFNSHGELEVTEKIIGSKKAIRTQLDFLLKNYDPDSGLPIYLPFAGDTNNVNELRDLIEEKLGVTNVICGPVGPVICSHTGPSLCGVAFMSKYEKK